jgi:steroid delta-isomerase-like uncharacterized protein
MPDSRALTDERRDLIARAWSAAWDHGDVDVLDDLLAPDYRRRGAEGGDGLTREEFKASITATRSAFPDLVTHVEDLVVEGDVAAVRWRSVGTHQHSFLGVPATRRSVEVSGATFAHFGEDGLVHLEHVTWDPRALLAALGIITVGADR